MVCGLVIKGEWKQVWGKVKEGKEKRGVQHRSILGRKQ